MVGQSTGCIPHLGADRNLDRRRLSLGFEPGLGNRVSNRPGNRYLVADIDIGGPYQGGDIAAGDGVVWASTGDGPLTVIDQDTDEVIQQWDSHGADAIALGAGSAWITDHDLETVYRYTLP